LLSSRGNAASQTVGVHGMLVAGGQRTGDSLRSGVYASHLPMFMPPHDFQVIMAVTGPAAARYGDFVAHFGSSDIYTFRPEPFSITELDPSIGGLALTSLRGSLFRGHYERGGSEIANDISFEVEQVICFQHLSADAAPDAGGQLRYLCFGARDAAFLAHLITAPPDFDQILNVEISSLTGVPDEDLRAGLIITVPDRANNVTDRLKETETFCGEVQGGRARPTGSIELKVAQEYYLETGDLASAM
jgi:hypothetical protein